MIIKHQGMWISWISALIMYELLWGNTHLRTNQGAGFGRRQCYEFILTVSPPTLVVARTTAGEKVRPSATENTKWPVVPRDRSRLHRRNYECPERRLSPDKGTTRKRFVFTLSFALMLLHNHVPAPPLSYSEKARMKCYRVIYKMKDNCPCAYQ